MTGLDRLRFAQPDVGQQVEDLTSGQQPVVGRDQAPEGVDCLASTQDRTATDASPANLGRDGVTRAVRINHFHKVRNMLL